MNSADPNCPLCDGSGINPDSPIETISIPPYCTDHRRNDMTETTRTFPLDQLKDWDVPHNSDTAIEVTNEWCVFRAPDDGQIYRLYFSPVFPDYAEMDWYDDLPSTLVCERVEKRQRTIVIDEWLPVATTPAAADTAEES